MGIDGGAVGAASAQETGGEVSETAGAVVFDHVSKRYRDGTLAVDDVTLEAPARRITVLLGSSGSGKTTLVRMVNRMLEPTSGRVLLDDVDVATLPAVNLRRSIGYVLQDGGLLPHRKVLDNIGTVLRLEGVSKAEARERASELMATVGLDPALGDRYPAQLSGGQLQRVGVARALANRPRLLLMDEAFSATDPLVRRELQDQLLDLHDRLGTTILFVTHDLDEAFRVGDRIALLRTGGQLAQVGSRSDFLDRPADEFVERFLDAGLPGWTPR